MIERLDSYIKAVWGKYGLWGFVLIIAVALAVVIVAALVLGIDVAGAVNRWLGVGG